MIVMLAKHRFGAGDSGNDLLQRAADSPRRRAARS
jgi:hypothetical protein